MRICVISTATTAHQMGGTEVHAEALAAEAARQGHTVLLVSSAHPAGIETEQKNGYEVRYLPGTDFSMSRQAARLWWEKSAFTLDALWKSWKFDVIWAENNAAKAYAALPRRRRAPVISIINGPGIIGGILSNFNRISTLSELLYFLTRYPAQQVFYGIPWFRATVKNSDLLAAVSLETAEALAFEFPSSRSKTIVLFNQADTQLFRPDAVLRAASRKELGFGEKETVVLMAGLLHKQKGVIEGLRAFADVARKHPEVRLLIVGDGPERKKLEAAAAAWGISGKTLFCGMLANSGMPRYYNAADIYLNPTLRHEGLPLVIVEAMACGLPSVISRIGGTGSTIDEGISGFYVKPGKEKELAEKLELLAGNPELRARLGEKAREKAVKAFDKKAILQKYISASLKLISAPKAEGK